MNTAIKHLLSYFIPLVITIGTSKVVSQIPTIIECDPTDYQKKIAEVKILKQDLGLPLKRLDTLQLALVRMDTTDFSDFVLTLNQYAHIDLADYEESEKPDLVIFAMQQNMLPGLIAMNMTYPSILVLFWSTGNGRCGNSKGHTISKRDFGS